MNKETEKNLKKQAAQLLNCFGYVNVKPNDLSIKDYANYTGFNEFILVKLGDKYYQLTYRKEIETQSWNLLDATEYVK